MSTAFKKTNLFRLLEEDDEQNEPKEDTENIFISSQSSYKPNKFGDESTYLDNSTVPTYEEFTTKTSSQKSKQHNGFNRNLLNSTEASYALVTDDDSSSEQSNDENDDLLYKKFDNLSLLNKKKEIKPLSTPIASKSYLTNNNLLLNKSPQVTPKLSDNDKFKFKVLQEKTIQKSAHFTPKSIVVSSPANQNTPRSIKKPNELANSFEYVVHNNKNLQTSFSSSQNDDICAGGDSVIEIVDSSINYTNELKDQIQNASVVEVVEAQSVGVSAMGASMLEPTMLKAKNLLVTAASSNATDFYLHLSSSSESNSPLAEVIPPKNNITMRKRESKRDSKRLSVTGRLVSVNTTNKKRVSMCGEELSEVVFNIDETIMDEYENELDEKNGRLFVLEESSEEKEGNLRSICDINSGSSDPSIIKETDPDDDSENSNSGSKNNYNKQNDELLSHAIHLEPNIAVDSILTSDKTSSDDNKVKKLNKSKQKEESSSSESQNEKPFAVHKTKKLNQEMSKKRISDDSSSNEDKLENFFTQYRPKVDEQLVKNKKNDIKDFIVNSDEEEQENEYVEGNDYEESPKPKKSSKKNVKATSKKLTNAKKILKSSSSSSFEPSSSKSNDENESDSDDNKYDKDLQLFYIKTTNKLSDDNKKGSKNNGNGQKKKTKGKASRSSLLDDSKSVISLVSSSSFTSSSDELPGLSSSSSDDDDSFGKRFRMKFPTNDFTNSQFKTPKTNINKAESDSRLVKTQAPVFKKTVKRLTFIESLSTNLTNEELRDPAVIPFIKKFKNKASKTELLKKCYDFFNESAFDNKLPHDMKLVWSGRLSSTGGYCKNSTRAGVRSSEIHISTKVCDCPERMRDTLAHEMCHAAAFLINGLLDGHGPVWKSWANRVNFTFKEIPKITVTHSYAITKKFIYRCTVCRFEIHRFSKSINIEKELCGLCHGKFEIHLNNPNQKDSKKTKLDEEDDDRFDKIKNDIYTIESPKIPANKVPVTPRQPNKFAMYVKDNYNSVKKEKNLNNHKDVMQELSKNFKTLSTK